MTTPSLFSTKEKELATLKQLFLFNVPKSDSASRQKSEANPQRNIASLVKGNTSSHSEVLYGKGTPTLANIHLKQRSALWKEAPSSQTSTSTSEAMLSPPLEDRHLAEEREKFFALSREEEKAV